MAIRHKTTMDISTQVSLKKCVCNLKENYIKFRKNFVKMSIGYLTEIRYPKQIEEILKDNRREKDMKVLLVGNTGYVTEEFVEEAFPECQVMVLGNKMIKTVRRRELISRPFPRTELELGDIFRTYEFEAVVYFSNYLTLHGELEGEAENLRKILQYCRKGVQSHFLYVTGPEGMFDVPTGKTLLVQNAEDVCRRYAGLYGLKVKILRVPYLYSGIYKKDFFYRIFQASKESQKLFFQEASEQKACFLYSMDLAELMYKLFDNWNDEEEVLNVPDVFDICFQDVTEELKKVLSPVSIIYKSSSVVEKIKEDDRQIRTNYNWFPKISVLDHISEMYEEYKKNNGEKASRFTRLFNQNQRWLRVCEFVVCFLAFEFLQRLLGNQAQFKMIDLRLVFIENTSKETDTSVMCSRTVLAKAR